jgi:hypothetical protein
MCLAIGPQVLTVLTVNSLFIQAYIGIAGLKGGKQYQMHEASVATGKRVAWLSSRLAGCR